MIANPAISVIMSLYNESEAWVRESIESILGQTFEDFEFIIINDNPSSPFNKEILNEFLSADKRVRVIDNPENMGLTKSLNIGIENASGKYIVRMDADDVSEPSRLYEQFHFMERHVECVVSGSYFETIGTSNKLVRFPTEPFEIKMFLLLDNCVAHPTAIIRHDTLRKYGLRYNESYRYSQDYGFWCILSKYGELRNIDKPLLKYRISDSQISTSKRDEQKEIVKSIRYEYMRSMLSELGIAADAFSLRPIKALDNEVIRDNLIKAYYVSLDISFWKKVISILFNGDLSTLNRSYINVLRRNS